MIVVIRIILVMVFKREFLEESSLGCQFLYVFVFFSHFLSMPLRNGAISACDVQEASG